MTRFKDSIARLFHWVMNQPFRNKLLLLFGFALVCRLPVIIGAAVSPGHSIGNDSEVYLDLARNLLDTGALVAGTAPNFEPEVYRTPGLPAILAGFMLVFGREPIFPVVLVQVVASCLTAVLAVLIARELFDETIAWVAGLVLAISTNQIVLSGFVLTETLSTTFMTVAVWLSVVALKREQWTLALLAGLTAGLSTYVRHVGLVLVPFLVLFFILQKPKQSYKYVIPFVVIFVVTILPWLLRNQSITGSLTFTPQGISNFEYYNAPSVESQRLKISLAEARERILSFRDEISQTNPNDQYERTSKLIPAYITRYPLEFVWYNGLDTLFGLLRPGYSQYFQLVAADEKVAAKVIKVFQYGTIADVIDELFVKDGSVLLVMVLMTVQHFVILAGVLVGFINQLWQKRWGIVVLLVGLPFTIMFIAGFQAHSRYRVFGDVLWAMVAASTFVWIYHLWADARARRNANPAAA